MLDYFRIIMPHGPVVIKMVACNESNEKTELTVVCLIFNLKSGKFVRSTIHTVDKITMVDLDTTSTFQQGDVLMSANIAYRFSSQ